MPKSPSDIAIGIALAAFFVVSLLLAVLSALDIHGTDAEVAAAWAAWAQLPLTGLGVWYVARTMGLTREIALADKRPWMQVQGKRNGDPREDDGKIVQSFDLQITNLGSVPAYGMKPTVLYTTAKAQDIDSSAFSNHVEENRNSYAGRGSVVVPQELVVAHRDIAFVAGAEEYVLYGCVVYRFPGSGRKHVTPFSFWVTFRRHTGEAITRVTMGPHDVSLPPD
ncbi:MAG: hypothetical protein JNJ73_01990 [Hyphomonadaceae bacterium]|nr:hypothetical protein [Hyphomonadaceae bacterium]